MQKQTVIAGARKLLRLSVQISMLWALSIAASALAAYLPIAVPPGVIGLVILFAVLASGIVKLAWFEQGAELLVRHLGLFLIPYAVSVLAIGEALAASAAALVGTLVLSTIVGIAVTGWTAQLIAQRHARRPVDPLAPRTQP
jgi:holin-like protein